MNDQEESISNKFLTFFRRYGTNSGGRERMEELTKHKTSQRRIVIAKKNLDAKGKSSKT